MSSKAISPDPSDDNVPSAAAVCVYPALVSTAKKIVKDSNVKVASVSSYFPSGQAPIESKISDTQFAIDEGADEIDIVINRKAFFEGDYKKVYEEIKALKDVCGEIHLKTILEIGELKTYENIKKASVIALCAGNIATPEAAKFLIKLGVDIIKIGIGPGSICTTRLVAGIGVPQLSAILAVRSGLKNKNVKIISDGGIKYSGDLAKAFAAGADAVMIGSLFAGTNETPGKLIKKNGQLFKSFRGMGSVGAMNKGSADRYFQKKQKDTSKYVPEGVEGFVKYKGDVGSIIYKLIGGLKSSMGYLGSKTIIKLRNKPQFVKITKAGFYESMVHNVDVVKNDSKY
jgi:deoxyribose-phosphate aldolase